MNAKRHNVQKLAVVAVMIVAMIVNLCLNPFYTYAYEQKKGVVNGSNVNVRTGPGTTYSKLTGNNGNVQLNSGDEVTVIGEANASDGALWYKISFKENSVTLVGYMHSDYVDIKENIVYEPDEDFEKYMEEQGFPETYKDGLRALHAKYPKWVFVADNVDYTWEEVLENESLIGRSLISINSISSWKSTDPKAYDWENGKWYGFDGSAWAASSEELVAYCLDPRNFFDEQGVFQFESLAYNESIHNIEGLNSVLKGSFMENAKIGKSMKYDTAIMNAAKQSNVSPYNIAVRIIQEQGINGVGKSISGTVAGYEGYYNYFNIGAYAANGNSAIINGLIYAKSGSSYNRPWNTRYKALIGGAKYLGSGYINQGQDTLYYQKFDLVGTPYTHQYMTHILAPSVEAVRMSNAYSDEVKLNTALIFKIPVYKNMPKKNAECPVGDGSPNNALSKLNVSGYNLTPTFSKFVYEYDLIVDNTVTSIKVNATPLDSSATVGGIGTKNLKVGINVIDVTVKAANGSVRTYTLNVARKDENNKLPEPEITVPEETTEHITGEEETTNTNETTTEEETTTQKPQVAVSSKYKIENDYVSKVEPGTTVKKALSAFDLENATAKILTEKNKVMSQKDIVGTGCKIVIYDLAGKKYKTYTFVIYGDVSGEGIIDIKDMLYVKLEILDKITLKGAKLEAADVSHGHDGVDIKDLLYVKLHILDKMYIVQ